MKVGISHRGTLDAAMEDQASEYGKNVLFLSQHAVLERQ